MNSRFLSFLLLRRIALGLLLGLIISSASGQMVFNYAYTFDDGLKATGTLIDVQNGCFIDNFSNASVSRIIATEPLNQNL